jgi:hypothetical protein
MKKTIGMMGVLALSLLFTVAHAQEPTTPTPSKPWDPKSNPTVDSIISPYRAKLIPARPGLTTADIFPVIGRFESTTNTDAANVTITLDADNKGLVWVEGLPQGKIRAMLRKSPATYKIPAQKTEDGKDVPEGTLIFDKEFNTLNIVIGKPFDVVDPSTAFAPATEEPVVAQVKVKGNKTKVKKVEKVKPWVYSGTKVETTTVSTSPVIQ